MPQAIFIHGEQSPRLDYTPAADVENGQIVHMGGGLVGICTLVEGMEANALGALATEGIWRVAKDGSGGPAFAIGDPVGWDESAEEAVAASDANCDYIIGMCVLAAGANQDYVIFRLNGMASGPSGLKVAGGQHTTVTASDTVVTGLKTLVGIVAVLDDDPVDGCQAVSASIGDQDEAPEAGSAYIKTWKATSDADATLIAATTFGKKVNWIAYGY